MLYKVGGLLVHAYEKPLCSSTNTGTGCIHSKGPQQEAWIIVPLSWCAFTVSSVSALSSICGCPGGRLARALAGVAPAAFSITSVCGTGAVKNNNDCGEVRSTVVHYASSTFPISTAATPTAPPRAAGVVTRGSAAPAAHHRPIAANTPLASRL